MKRAPSAAKLVVVLVEDDDATREVFGMALEMEDLVVVTAASAQEALERIPVLRPAAVITDLTLAGGVGGAALVRALRAQPDLAGVRYVAVTGTHRDQLPAEECALFDEVFLKPVDIGVVARAIREAVPASTR